MLELVSRLVFLRICVEHLWLKTCDGNCVQSKHTHTKTCLYSSSSFNPCLATCLLFWGSCPLHWFLGPDLFLAANLHSLTIYWMLSCSYNCTLFKPLVHTWLIYHQSLGLIWKIPTETLSWLWPWLHLLTSLLYLLLNKVYFIFVKGELLGKYNPSQWQHIWNKPHLCLFILFVQHFLILTLSHLK